MSMSDNDTNELDSYGVWVKHSSGDENLSEVTEGVSVEAAEDSLDLPDFDDSDFSDMFKDDSQFSSDLNEDFSSDNDTTLSADELANITSGDISLEETPVVEAQEEETSTDNLDFDFDTEINEEKPEEDFTISESTEENIEIPSPDFGEELNLDDFETETVQDAQTEGSSEPVSEEPSFEEVSFEDMSIDESSEENVEIEESPIETSSTEEEISIDSFDMGDASSEAVTDESGEEEISLDDFMDEGFSDESVASGNNGFEEGKQPSAETEEVSLDDFVDMSEFGVDAASEAKPEDEIVDEAPLNMDISFDSSADSIETEENDIVEDEPDDDNYEENITQTEEVSLNDFGDDFVESVSSAADSQIDTEEVDLSDFGIDSEAEETPIVQDVEESKTHDTVVDFDLSVGNENTTSAPVVNVIEDSIEQQEEVTEPVKETPAAAQETVSTSLLQQIVADLSGLKDEINQLKTNLAEIKSGNIVTSPAPAIEEEPVVEETFAEETVTEEPIIPETDDSSSGGFFDLDDTDETIALSGDELDNIFNSAQFNEIETTDAALSDEETIEVPETNEITEEEPAVEETFSEEEIVTEETTEEEQSDESFEIENSEDLPSEIPFDETETEETVEENVSTQEFDIENTIEETIPQSISEELNSKEDISFDFENENLEEPSFDGEIAIDEDTEDSDLPDEISIPKSDDILVETDNSDFMDSVKDNTETETISEIDSLPEDEEVKETEETSFDSVDSFLEDNEPVIEETAVSPEEVEEPVTEEPAIEEPAAEEPAPAPQENFSEIDNLNNDLSDSNFDYLTKKDSESEEVNTDSDLKKDIKSVLLYMDQLLENLPEDKIIEFAKSDEFSTYKKLFSELGLS